MRRQSGASVVAITGSAGKTTTKEATAAFSAARYAVYRNAGNLNNHIGLPLSLLELRRGPDVAVVELGMNHAGRNPHAGRDGRAGRPRVDQRRRRAHRILRVAEAIADAKAEILEGAGPGDAARRATPTTRA